MCSYMVGYFLTFSPIERQEYLVDINRNQQTRRSSEKLRMYRYSKHGVIVNHHQFISMDQLLSGIE